MSRVTVTALMSAKGSPGVTTSALALAACWPREVLLAECDLAGGDLLTGYLGGQVTGDGGLLALAVAARRGLTGSDVLAHSLRLDDSGRLCVLTGLADPAQAPAVTGVWDAIGHGFAELAVAGRDVVVDCGRLTGATLPGSLLAVCDRVVVVLRPTLTQVRLTRALVTGLRPAMPAGPDGVPVQPELLLVGDRPYPADEVASAVGAAVVAVLPCDPPAARVLAGDSGPGRRFARSPLMRAAGAAAARLTAPPGTTRELTGAVPTEALGAVLRSGGSR